MPDDISGPIGVVIAQPVNARKKELEIWVADMIESARKTGDLPSAAAFVNNGFPKKFTGLVVLVDCELAMNGNCWEMAVADEAGNTVTLTSESQQEEL